MPAPREIVILPPPGQLYVRFGKFNARAGSRVGMDREFRDEVLSGRTRESGTSVYFVRKAGPRAWEITPPDRRMAAYHQSEGDYWESMLERFRRSIERGEVYLLRGSVIVYSGTHYDEGLSEDVNYTTFEAGTDGEPLLDPSSIRQVRRFTPCAALRELRLHRVPIGDRRMWWGQTLRDALTVICPPAVIRRRRTGRDTPTTRRPPVIR